MKDKLISTRIEKNTEEFSCSGHCDDETEHSIEREIEKYEDSDGFEYEKSFVIETCKTCGFSRDYIESDLWEE